MEAHIADVLGHLAIADKSKGWRIDTAMVVEAELLTPFISEVPVPVISFDELAVLATNGDLQFDSLVARSGSAHAIPRSG